MKYYITGIAISLFTFSTALCQSLTKEQINFLEKNAKTIYPDTVKDQPDWSFILQHVKDKKLILLGEFNHGSKEVFELRNSLVKYLHQKTGAKTILLESGIGELITADIHKAQMSPSQMTNGLFGGWRTKEFADLFDYVRLNGISIAGFDVQRTGGTFNTVLHSLAQQYKLDTLNTNDLESRYTLAARELSNKKASYDSLVARIRKLILDYHKVKAELSPYINSDAPKDLLLASLTIENRISYLAYMLRFLNDRDWSQRWAARDAAMANNIHWLINYVYKDFPIIIIGHNFHLGKHNEHEKVMGEILSSTYKNDMYSIGIFAGSGAYSDNSGKEVNMVPQDSVALDIKHIIATLPGTATFLHIPGSSSKGNDWLHKEITVNDTFIDLKNTNKMVLSRTFDGLILLKKVSPAKTD